MSCNAPTQQSLRNIDPEPEQCEYTCDYTFKYPSSSQLQLINEKENGFVESSNFSNFFSVGKKDQWKNLLSKNQIFIIENEFRSEMKNFGYL